MVSFDSPCTPWGVGDSPSLQMRDPDPETDSEPCPRSQRGNRANHYQEAKRDLPSAKFMFLTECKKTNKNQTKQTVMPGMNCRGGTCGDEVVNGDSSSMKGIEFVKNSRVPRKPQEGRVPHRKGKEGGGLVFHIITMNCTSQESSGSQSVVLGTAAPESWLQRTSPKPLSRALELQTRV